MVEQAGQYLLPEQLFYWWDSRDRELKTVLLPELKIDAGIATSSSAGSESTPLRVRIREQLPQTWLLAALLGLVVGLGLLLWRRRPRPASESKLLRQVGRALRRGDNERAARLLYRWLNTFQPQPDWYRLRAALARAAGDAGAQQVDILLAKAYGGADDRGPVFLARVKPIQTGWLAGSWQKLRLKSVQLKLNPDDIAVE